MRRLLLVIALSVLPFGVLAQDFTPAETEYVRGRVMEVEKTTDTSFEDLERVVQDTAILILDGKDAGEAVALVSSALPGREDMILTEGEVIVLQRLEKANGEVDYLIRDKYRLPSLFYLTAFFFLLGIVVAGRIGFTAILGLIASIAVIVLFIVPRIAAGDHPLVISLIGSVFIACTSLYLAHGFNRRTTLAVISTILTLCCSVLLAITFVSIAKLFGMGTEESVFLQFGELSQVNLRGLLLGGIIIGALGVLDDITTSQTAAVDQLSKANHTLGPKELFAAGNAIGREHSASLINTLALAYAGASLPLLLLFSINTESPWWVVLNGEFLAEELVRTLVGSSTLLLAVPISTWFAARSFAYGRHSTGGGRGPCCHH